MLKKCHFLPVRLVDALPIADFIDDGVPNFSLIFFVVDDLVVDDDFLDVPPPNVAESRVNVPRLNPIDSFEKVEFQPLGIVVFFAFHLPEMIWNPRYLSISYLEYLQSWFQFMK